MGCEYCKYSNYGESDCTAPLSFRKHFCGVGVGDEGSNYTRLKKKKRKKEGPKTHRLHKRKKRR